MVGVINGVFIQETFKVVAADDTIMVRRKRLAGQLHKKKMEKLFEAAKEAKQNSDGEDYITKKGYKQIMRQPEVSTWLSAMELDPGDAERLFTLLDASGTNDGTLTLDELVKGVA